MPSTIRKSAVTVAALGRSASAGPQWPAPPTIPSHQTALAGLPAARGAVQRGRGEGQGRRARQGPGRDRPAHRGRRALQHAVPRPHPHVRRHAPGRAGELVVRGHDRPSRRGRRGGRGGGPGGRGPGRGETALTGETKEKVEAAVLAKYPGVTIVRTETNRDSSAPYESHIKTTDGNELEVLVSKDFEVVDAREHPARP